MDKRLKNELNDFSTALKDYLQLQLEMEKLSLIEKLSGLGAYFFKIFVVVYFALLIAAFLLGAVAVWLGMVFNSYLAGVLTAGAVLLVAAVLLILMRKKIAVNSGLANLSRILLNDDEK